MANFNGLAAIETPEFMASVKDKLGTVDAYNHYSVGLGVGDVHAVPVDQAGRLALGWHPQRHDRALAGRDHRQGRTAVAVLPRHRRRPDDSRGRGTAGAGLRQRRAAVADRGHQHGLHLRRRRRAGTARPAVLRDGRQPRHLLQGLERGHPAQHSVAAARGAARSGRRRVGALRRQQRLDAGPRPGRRAARAAREAATAVADRSGQVQRAADRRPPVRAAQRDHRRPTAADHRQPARCCSPG